MNVFAELETEVKTKKPENVFADLEQDTLLNPALEDEQIKETVDLSDKYNIPIADSMNFVSTPEPSLFGRQLERIREFVREKTGLFEPPIYGPEYREEKPFRTAGKMAAYYGAETISGLTLTALDVLADKTKGDKTLADSVARITGFEPTPEEKQIGETAKYIATFTPAGKLVGAAIKVIPVSALKTILDSGLTFATTDAAIQFSKNITQGTPVNWEQIHAAGGVGVLFGTGEVVVAATINGLIKGMDKYWGEKGIELASKIRPEGTSLEEQVARQNAEVTADANRARETFRKTGKMPEDLMEKYVYGKPAEGSALAPKEIKVSPEEKLVKTVGIAKKAPAAPVVARTTAETGIEVAGAKPAEKPESISKRISVVPSRGGYELWIQTDQGVRVEHGLYASAKEARKAGNAFWLDKETRQRMTEAWKNQGYTFTLPEAAEAKPAEKQFWKMSKEEAKQYYEELKKDANLTKEEFAEKYKGQYGEKYLKEYPYALEYRQKTIKEVVDNTEKAGGFAKERKNVIKKAYERGLDVPPEVLAEYPELTKEVKAAEKPKVKKQRKLLSANQISDFEIGRDKVVRRGDKTFVVDTQGQRADTEVQSDVITPEVVANIQKLTPEQKVRMADEIRRTPYLSEEGRKERLEIIEAKPPSAEQAVSKEKVKPIPKEELPSSKIKSVPKPGDKEAGFVEIPPITTAGKIEAEHPNIEVRTPKKDIGILQKHILTLTNQAQNSKNPAIIEAAEEMADIGMVMHNETQAQLTADQHIYKTLPKEYRENKGEKFFELMDKEFSPEQIEKAKEIPDEVKPILRHFKLREEEMRLEIVKQKRKMAKAILGRKSLDELQKMATDNGIEITKPGKTVEEKNRTIAELSTDLAEIEIPDTWGKKWSHIQHIFFGQYELKWEEIDPETGKITEHFIGRAETQTEAYEKLANWKAARQMAGFDDYNKVKLVADPEFNIPYDVLRISRKHFYVLEKQIEEAANIERQEVEDALKGIIGKRESKQKWWGALMHRKGAPDYSQDFWKVWQMETTYYNRWKHLSEMNRKVTPLIERIRSEGLRGWAQQLEDARDDLWGRKRADTGRILDEYLAKMPLIKNYVKPFAFERWTGIIKALNYWRHLQTGRFYILNSLQPMQTLYPVVGEKGIYRGIKLYYSKKGQDLLRKYHIAGISGKLHEFGMPGEKKIERFLPAGASEIRNQGLAFLTLYDDGIRRGMTEEQAVRYGRLRGQLFTQFTYTRSDIPKVMRGPTGGLIFQYKRFQIKNLELVSRLIREGNWGGVSRWIGANLVIGGLHAFTKVLPVGLAGFLTLELYNRIKEEYGEETAQIIHHGLPALIGIDMSGSIGPFDMPYGEGVYDSAGRLVFGPTGQTAVQIIEDVMNREVTKEVGIYERLEKSFIDQSPTVKQFIYLIKALQQDISNYDAKQRSQYRLDTWDLWKKALALRPETETEQRMQYEAMMDIKDEYDAVQDHIVLAIIEGDKKEAEKLLSDWQANYPEFPLTSESIRNRIKEKVKARELTVTTRQFLTLPKALRPYFKEVIEEEKEYRKELKK